MAHNVLFTGHTGTLGTAFINQTNLNCKIVGISRKSVSELNCIKQIESDLTSVKSDLLEMCKIDNKPFDHVIFAANLCQWKPFEQLSDSNINDGISVGIISVMKLTQQLLLDWKDCKHDKSITIVSSLAASKVFGTNQVLYGVVKAAQIALAEQLWTVLEPFNIRVNVLIPNSFPSIVNTEQVVQSIDNIIKTDVNKLKLFLL